MSWRRRRCGAVLAAGFPLFAAALARAQEPVAPPAALAAARAAAADTARGELIHVTLLTVGPGDEVFERFGHNLLWIRNLESGESVVWDWGLFDFEEPGFYTRFLFGNTRYWMAGHDPQRTLDFYRARNREVIAQDLALTPGQRAALDTFVRVNAADENKFYRYAYFTDNCSTRLRDALDIVTDGAIRRALDSSAAKPLSYRTETLRLVQPDPWLVLGMDIALGLPADHKMSDWQQAFIPMRLRDALRTVSVHGVDGAMVPFVADERVLVSANRAATREDVNAGPPAMLVLGAATALALVSLLLGEAAHRGVRFARGGLVTLGIITHVGVGLIATALLFMWSFTRHDFWNWNPHLLLATPVSFAVAGALPAWAASESRHTWLRSYHLGMAGLAVAVAIGLLVSFRQFVIAASGLLMVWAHAAWMVYLALYVAVRRSRGGGGVP